MIDSLTEMPEVAEWWLMDWEQRPEGGIPEDMENDLEYMDENWNCITCNFNDLF